MVARTLHDLSDANRLTGSPEEGTQQAREALGIFQRLGRMAEQGQALINLAWVLRDDGQLDAAEEAALSAIELLPKDGELQRAKVIEFLVLYAAARWRRPSITQRCPAWSRPL